MVPSWRHPLRAKPSRLTPKRSAACMAKDTNPKTAYGEAKSPLGLIPGNALVHCAEALRDGADKYGPANWRIDPVSASTYWFALLRHGFQWWDGEDVDPASMVLHLGAVMANAAILIDALESKTLLDDRPPASTTAQLIRDMTRPIHQPAKEGALARLELIASFKEPGQYGVNQQIQDDIRWALDHLALGVRLAGV